MEDDELVEEFCQKWEGLIPSCGNCLYWAKTSNELGICNGKYYISENKILTKKKHGCYEYKNK